MSSLDYKNTGVVVRCAALAPNGLDLGGGWAAVAVRTRYVSPSKTSLFKQDIRYLCFTITGPCLSQASCKTKSFPLMREREENFLLIGRRAASSRWEGRARETKADVETVFQFPVFLAGRSSLTRLESSAQPSSMEFKLTV